jgi:hypothetical protein
MIAQLLIFLLFTAIGAWLITKIKFFKASLLKPTTLVSLYFIKVGVGIAYAWAMLQQQTSSGLPTDTLKYFEYSIADTDLLFNNPKLFFSDLFVNQYGKDGFNTIWASTGSFWADFKNWIFIKALALLNVITNKNYLANLAIVNFICFYGWMALYKIATNVLNLNKTISLLIVFAIPSTLFWHSGLHKDAFIFNSVALAIYAIFNFWQTKAVKYFLLFGLHLLVLFLFRMYTLIFLLVGISVAYGVIKKQLRLSYALLGFGLFSLATIALASYLPDSLNVIKIFQLKQSEFLKIKAASDINPIEISNLPLAFILQTPLAFVNCWFPTSFINYKNLSSLFTSLESFIIYLCFVLTSINTLILRRKKPTVINKTQLGFIGLVIGFTLITSIVVGFINVNVGSIIRYKSLLYPYILMATYFTLNQFTFNKLKA